MQMKNENVPEDFSSLEDLRVAIDRLDKAIIELVAKRSQYIEMAARFKADENSVRDPERVMSMLEERREWAVENGLDPDVIEKMYRDLLEYFVSEELKSWKSDTGKGK